MRTTNTNFLNRETPVLTEEDIKELEPIMGNLNKIHDTIKRGVSEELLAKMIVYENKNRRRKLVVLKLLGRLKSTERNRIQRWLNQR